MNAILQRLLPHLDRLLRGLLVILVFALVASVTWQVASRYLLQSPSSWTEELARFLLIWIGLIGAAYAFRTQAHMRIAFLENKLGATWGHRLRRVSAAAVFLFATTVMLAGGMKLVLLTLELKQISAALQIPMGVVYLALPVSGTLIALYALASLGDQQEER